MSSSNSSSSAVASAYNTTAQACSTCSQHNPQHLHYAMWYSISAAFHAPATQNHVDIDPLLWGHHPGGLCCCTHVAAAVQHASSCCRCAFATGWSFSAKATTRCCLGRTACFVHLSAEAEVALSALAPMQRGQVPQRCRTGHNNYICVICTRSTM
jgi:hypothetical protein